MKTKILRSYALTLLRSCILTLFLSSALTVLNAQIEKNELNLTPEMEEMILMQIQNLPEKDYSEYGITDRSQLENLQLGKPIPQYFLVSEKLPHRFSGHAILPDGEPLTLEFANNWTVPVMSGNEPLLFVGILNGFGNKPFIDNDIKNIIEHFYNYEYQDSIIGYIGVNPSPPGIDHLIIRKDNQDIVVEIYDEVTGTYFKNEYRLSELIPHLKELHLREREAEMKYYERYYAQVADKSELILTPEISKMLINQAYSSHIKDSDEELSRWGIKDRAQLDHLHMGKPIPMYRIVNESLTFTGKWFVLVMSGDEPLFRSILKLADDGQYRWAGSGSGGSSIHNYEHKDLIIGILGTTSFNGLEYIMIRRENQDIFVKWYNRATGERFKNEYTLSEIMNMIKK